MSKLLLWWDVDLDQAGRLHGDIGWCILYIGSDNFFVNVVILLFNSLSIFILEVMIVLLFCSCHLFKFSFSYSL